MPLQQHGKQCQWPIFSDVNGFRLQLQLILSVVKGSCALLKFFIIKNAFNSSNHIIWYDRDLTCLVFTQELCKLCPFLHRQSFPAKIPTIMCLNYTCYIWLYHTPRPQIYFYLFITFPKAARQVKFAALGSFTNGRTSRSDKVQPKAQFCIDFYSDCLSIWPWCTNKVAIK